MNISRLLRSLFAATASACLLAGCATVDATPDRASINEAELVLVRFDKGVFMGKFCRRAHGDAMGMDHQLFSAAPEVLKFGSPRLVVSFNATAVAIDDGADKRTEPGRGVMIISDWRKPLESVFVPQAKRAEFLNEDVVAVQDSALRWSLWSASGLCRTGVETFEEKFIPLAASEKGEEVVCWNEPLGTPYVLLSKSGVRSLEAKTQGSAIATWSPATNAFLLSGRAGISTVSREGKESLTVPDRWLEWGILGQNYVLTGHRESFVTELRDTRHLHTVIDRLPFAMGFFRFNEHDGYLYANRIKNWGREESVWSVSGGLVNRSDLFVLDEPYTTKVWLRQ